MPVSPTQPKKDRGVYGFPLSLDDRLASQEMLVLGPCFRADGGGGCLAAFPYGSGSSAVPSSPNSSPIFLVAAASRRQGAFLIRYKCLVLLALEEYR